MINYNLTIIAIKIIRLITLSLFIVFIYPPTKKIICDNLKGSLNKFHSKYLEPNYHLSLLNLNTKENINEALIQIKKNPEIYDRILEEDLLVANLAHNILRSFKKYQLSLLCIVTFSIVTEAAIKVGINLL